MIETSKSPLPKGRRGTEVPGAAVVDCGMAVPDADAAAPRNAASPKKARRVLLWFAISLPFLLYWLTWGNGLPVFSVAFIICFTSNCCMSRGKLCARRASGLSYFKETL